LKHFFKKLLYPFEHYVTVLVIPHTNLPVWRMRLSFHFVLTMLALWGGVTIWAGYLAGRHVDYWITKADNQVMRVRMSYLASEMDRSRQDLERARDTDQQMRVLLGMHSRRAVVELDEGMGGPTAMDRWNLLQRLHQDPLNVSPAEIRRSLRSVERESQQRLASFQEISWYITNKRSLYRSTPLGWPTEGRITSKFGYRFSPISIPGDPESSQFHSGLDIANSPDTPILATADGVVRKSGWAGGYGRMVLVEHDWGYATLYAHTSKALVHEGEVVKRGQVIAYMGTTGRSTGTHLHYEVWRHGHPVNPMPYLKSHLRESI
jgi:hypothetical protein